MCALDCLVSLILVRKHLVHFIYWPNPVDEWATHFIDNTWMKMIATQPRKTTTIRSVRPIPFDRQYIDENDWFLDGGATTPLKTTIRTVPIRTIQRVGCWYVLLCCVNQKITTHVEASSNVLRLLARVNLTKTRELNYVTTTRTESSLTISRTESGTTSIKLGFHIY